MFNMREMDVKKHARICSAGRIIFNFRLLTIRQWLSAFCVRALECLEAAFHHMGFGKTTHARQAESMPAGGAAEVRSCRTV